MDVLEGLRTVTLVAPLVSFAYVQQWLTAKIRKGLSNLDYKSDPLDPEYLEWDALANALDAVVSRLLLVSERPNVQSGLQLLELCLSYAPRDAWLLSTLLSSISALFVFLSMSTGSMAMPGVAVLPRVLEKIFAALVFLGPGETLDNLSKATKNVRRHAGNLMVKIGLKFPLLLLPIFDQIHTTVRRLTRQLTRMETLNLYEALLLITNQFCDYERQTRFILEIMGDTSTHLTNVGAEAFKGPVELMRHIGLDRQAIDHGPDDPIVQNRSNLMFYVNTIMCVVKRCSIPEDPDRAARGGFVAALSENGNPVYRNPATPHILPVLSPLFALLQALNALFTPMALNVLSEGYKNAYGILEMEKIHLLGSNHLNGSENSVETENSSLTKMQTFLTTIHDNCYHLLGNACHTIGRELYQLSGFTNVLLGSVFSNLEVNFYCIYQT